MSRGSSRGGIPGSGSAPCMVRVTDGKASATRRASPGHMAGGRSVPAFRSGTVVCSVMNTTISELKRAPCTAYRHLRQFHAVRHPESATLAHHVTIYSKEPEMLRTALRV